MANGHHIIINSTIADKMTTSKHHHGLVGKEGRIRGGIRQQRRNRTCANPCSVLIVMMAFLMLLSSTPWTTMADASFVPSPQQQNQLGPGSGRNKNKNDGVGGSNNREINGSCLGGGSSDNHIGSERARQIMYNQQSRKREMMTYQIIAAEACEPLARRFEEVSEFSSVDVVLAWTLHAESLQVLLYRFT